MKKVANKVGKLSFPKAPTAISERSLAKVTGGGVMIDPCFYPSTLEPCFRPGLIIPCVRPR